MTFKDFVYKQHNMTFYALSKKAGIPESTLRNMHLRDSVMNTNLSVIIKIAQALEIGVDQFIQEMQQEALEPISEAEQAEIDEFDAFFTR